MKNPTPIGNRKKEKKGKPFDRVKALEAKVDELWSQIFCAARVQLGKPENKDLLLKGRIDKLEDQLRDLQQPHVSTCYCPRCRPEDLAPEDIKTLQEFAEERKNRVKPSPTPEPKWRCANCNAVVPADISAQIDHECLSYKREDRCPNSYDQEGMKCCRCVLPLPVNRDCQPPTEEECGNPCHDIKAHKCSDCIHCTPPQQIGHLCNIRLSENGYFCANEGHPQQIEKQHMCEYYECPCIVDENACISKALHYCNHKSLDKGMDWEARWKAHWHYLNAAGDEVDWDQEIKQFIAQELALARRLAFGEAIRVRPDYYTKEQIRFTDASPESYGLKKNSPEWYNLALTQWEKAINSLSGRTKV